MKITFTKPTLIKSGAIVVFALAGKKLSKTAEQVDQATDGALTRAIKASVFTGKKGDLLEIVAPATVPASRVVMTCRFHSSRVSCFPGFWNQRR